MAIKINKPISNYWIPILILISFVATCFTYGYLPDQIPIQWGMSGEINRYGSRNYALLLGALPSLIYILTIALPHLDPKKGNYKKHDKSYKSLKILLIFFFIAFHWLAMIAVLRDDFNISLITQVAIGILFIGIGNILPRFRSNFFVGIKTPWTLSSETVWKKTHRVGGYYFMISGILFILAGFLAYSSLYVFTFIFLLGGCIGLCVYSYLLFKKETSNSR